MCREPGNSDPNGGQKGLHTLDSASFAPDKLAGSFEINSASTNSVAPPVPAATEEAAGFVVVVVAEQFPPFAYCEVSI